MEFWRVGGEVTSRVGTKQLFPCDVLLPLVCFDCGHIKVFCVTESLRDKLEPSEALDANLEY